MIRQKRADMAAAVVGTAIYFVVLRAWVPFVYGIIDDRSMMEIVSGQYLGHVDAHTIFIGYWYSLALSGLYNMVPNIDWYALSYMLLQGMCMSLILYRLFRKQKTVRSKAFYAAAGILAFGALGLQAAVQLTFTTTAAVLGVTVIFWYMTSERFDKNDLIVIAILCFFTYQIRYDIFYMILPVCGILWLFRFFAFDGKSLWHSLLPVVSVGVLCLGILGNALGYGSPDWKAYKKYDQNRTMVYDFPDHTFPVYEGAEDFYASIGIEKKSRARTLLNYNYTADERITPDFFGEYIAAYDAAFPSSQSVADRILQSVKEYIKGAMSGRFHVGHIFSLAGYAVLAVWYFFKRKWIHVCKVVCAAGVQILLWFYLLYTGRMPDRVIYSMNLMMYIVVILLWMERLGEKKTPKKINRVGIWIVCLVFGALTVTNICEFRQKNLEMSHRNEDIEALKEYCMDHPENFYFNDVTSMAFTTYNVHLWQEHPYVMNYMSLGDWMCYSPIWREKLTQNGFSSVKEALYESNHVYLICSFDKGLEYLELLYDDVVCTETDKIPGFRIYELRIDE